MEIVNTEMAKHWDGEEGDDWTEHAERYNASSRYVGEHFTATVPIAATDHVLDVGCGTGQATREAARAAHAGRAVGIDLSTRMLEYARLCSDNEGLTNVEYLHGDAQVYPLPAASFDLAMSHFGAMFFAGPVEAFTNVHRALRPNGRLAVLAWQPFEHQAWLGAFFDALAAGRDLAPPTPGQPGPFGLADRDAVQRILDEAGFADIDITAIDAPMWLGADADDAWVFVSGMGIVRGLTGGLDDAAKQAALARLRQVVEAHETPAGVIIGAGEWIITARA